MQRIKKSREERNKKHSEMVAKLEKCIKEEEEKLVQLNEMKVNNEKEKRRIEIQRKL